MPSSTMPVHPIVIAVATVASRVRAPDPVCGRATATGLIAPALVRVAATAIRGSFVGDSTPPRDLIAVINRGRTGIIVDGAWGASQRPNVNMVVGPGIRPVPKVDFAA